MASVPDFILPNNKATKLANPACAYCGAKPTPDNPLTDEHVVGRRFVPRGAFANEWCLILRACQRCNNEKADLEDDISAVTLLPPLGRSHEDQTLAALSARKARGSMSRRTGKPVAESSEQSTLKGLMMPGVDVTFGFIAPPQLDRERVIRLACFHLQGFFYLITYDDAQGTGSGLPGTVGMVNHAPLQDWGNGLQRGFASLTRDWPMRVEGTGASGHFRIAIRHDPAGADLWSFALEWNKSHRLVGFFGDLDAAQTYVDTLPPLQWRRAGPSVRMRREIPLAEEEDVLFG